MHLGLAELHFTISDKLLLTFMSWSLPSSLDLSDPSASACGRFIVTISMQTYSIVIMSIIWICSWIICPCHFTSLPLIRLGSGGLLSLKFQYRFINQSGIACKIFRCCKGDPVCRWSVAKKTKIFWNHINCFLILPWLV